MHSSLLSPYKNLQMAAFPLTGCDCWNCYCILFLGVLCAAFFKWTHHGEFVSMHLLACFIAVTTWRIQIKFEIGDANWTVSCSSETLIFWTSVHRLMYRCITALRKPAVLRKWYSQSLALATENTSFFGLRQGRCTSRSVTRGWKDSLLLKRCALVVHQTIDEVHRKRFLNVIHCRKKSN
jgi:hypothetical protein